MTELTIEETPDGKFAITDATGTRHEFNSREEAETALQQMSPTTSHDHPHKQS